MSTRDDHRLSRALEGLAESLGYERAWITPTGRPEIILERPDPQVPGCIQVMPLSGLVEAKIREAIPFARMDELVSPALQLRGWSLTSDEIVARVLGRAAP